MELMYKSIKLLREYCNSQEICKFCFFAEEDGCQIENLISNQYETRKLEECKSCFFAIEDGCQIENLISNQYENRKLEDYAAEKIKEYCVSRTNCLFCPWREKECGDCNLINSKEEAPWRW